MKREYVMNQPLVPELEEFMGRVREIFGARWLTNFGRVEEEFQRALQSRLGAPFVLPVTNATFGLFTVLKALGVKGEVLTVPYTFPATYHTLFHLPETRPVFVDVSPESFCIDPEKAEAAITPATTAILAVHAYGFPCDVERLGRIARDRGLALIYDAAPCFGVRLQGASVTRFGDAAVLSFHGTKVFHTAEGGAIVCRDAELLDRCRLFTNFGIRNEWTVETAGLNGKLDEIRSALGLVNLKRVDEGIRSRERVVRSYLDFFRSLAHESIRVNPHLYEDPDVELNYTYFPIVVAPSARLSRDILYRKLRERRIHSRTYYFPTVLDLPVYERYDFRTGDVSNAAYLSRNVLCLPVNPYFDEEDVAYITGCLADILGKR